MASFKKRNDLEFNNGNNNIPDSFDYRVEASANGLGEDFVFKFEDNKVVATNDVGLTGLEENDESASNASAKQQTVDDNNQQRNRNNNNDNSTESTSESAEVAGDSAAATSGSSSAASSSSASASASSAASAGASVASAVGTVAAVATSAVVLVVGGTLAVYGQTIERPNICEFEQLDATTNSISFALLVGNDAEKLEDEEQEDAVIEVNLECESYLEFHQDVTFSQYGRLEGAFGDLQPGTEYTINVVQRSLLDLNNDILLGPIKLSTLAEDSGVVAPTSFAISPSEYSMNPEETVQLSITNVAPENADKSVTWKSDNERVVTVDSTGLVTAVSDSVDPVTITATSTLNTTVYATASITVNPFEPTYNPTFEKEINPFGQKSIYMTVDVQHDDRTFDYVELTFNKLDRSTGEKDPESQETYCTLSESPEVRQVISGYPEDLDDEGLYSVLLEGFIPGEGQGDPSGNPDSSQPQGDGELVSLWEDQVDFAEIETTVAGEDTHSNNLYLRYSEVVDGDYNVVESSYEAFLDLAQVDGVDFANGETEKPYYVGVFGTTAADTSYGSQEMDTSFVIEETRTIVPIALDDSSISSYWSWSPFDFIVFQQNDERQFVEVFRQSIIKSNIAQVSTPMAEGFMFEKEVDPFGNTYVYAQLQLNTLDDLSEGYFTFKEIDRSTGEETGEEVYAFLQEHPKNRQIVNFSDGEFKDDGLYSYTFEALVTDDQGGQSGGTYRTLIRDRQIDFSEVPTTVVGQGTHSDHLYLRHVDLTDAEGNPISAFSHYDAYLDLEDYDEVSSNQRAVGVFESDAQSLEYGSNEMKAAFKIDGIGRIIESVDFDATNLNIEADLTFVIYEMVQDVQDYQYVQEFTQVIRLDSVAYRSMGFIGNGSLDSTKSYYGNHRIELTLGGNHLDELPDGWSVSLTDTVTGDEYATSDTQFMPLDSTGEKYYYDTMDPQDYFYEGLSTGNDKLFKVVAQIGNDTVTLYEIEIQPSMAGEEEYMATCAEFTYQTNETIDDATGDTIITYTVYVRLHMDNEDLFEEYDEIIISGSVGFGGGEFEVTLVSYSQVGLEIAITAPTDQGGEVLVFENEPDFSYTYLSYSIVGNRADLDEPVLLYAESNGIH